MPALLIFVVSVAALDSLNPSTVAPALYLATSRGGARSVAAFTAGVFGVLLAGGVALTLGPGRLLVAAVPRPGPHVTHLLEVCLGVAALVAALVLWLVRDRVARRLARPGEPAGRSSLLLGAGIMAVELPTALPYFAVILAVADSGRSTAVQLALIVLFDLVFVFPLIVILLVRALLPGRGVQLLTDLHHSIHRRAAVLLPALLAVVGVVLVAIGWIGLAGE